MDRADRTDRIYPATRWVAAIIIPFLVVAFVILYFMPGSTETRFAWKILPAMSAMMLGAAYAGGIWFFTGVILARQWHRVWLGLLPVTFFAGILGVTTVLHWDRFNHGTLPFAAWSTLYFTTPFIVFCLWLWNRREDPVAPEPDDALFSRPVRMIFLAVGILISLISAALFFQPAPMMGLWPWTLTLLTARVTASMFALAGVIGLELATEQRWGAAKLLLQSQMFSILLILIAAARDWSSFDPSQISTWLFVLGLGGMEVGILVFYLFMESRRGRAPAMATD
jgi:hypothetical protein